MRGHPLSHRGLCSTSRRLHHPTPPGPAAVHVPLPRQPVQRRGQEDPRPGPPVPGAGALRRDRRCGHLLALVGEQGGKQRLRACFAARADAQHVGTWAGHPTAAAAVWPGRAAAAFVLFQTLLFPAPVPYPGPRLTSGPTSSPGKALSPGCLVCATCSLPTLRSLSCAIVSCDLTLPPAALSLLQVVLSDCNAA